MIKMLFTLFFFTLSINADHVHWMGNYDKALQKAQKEQKFLMVLLVKKECSPCNDVIKDTFMGRDYVKHLNQKFVSVIVTYEGRASYPIEMFYSTSFPTLFFVSSQTETFLAKPMYGKTINANTIENILKEI
jgi:thioredoxin-related protein